MDNQEARRLVLEAQDGKIEAFNYLVEAHQSQAYNLALRVLGDPDQAADATQEAFIKAYRHLHRFDGRHFRTWLMRIVTNTCLDMLRSWHHRTFTSLDALAQADTRVPHLSARSPQPERSALRQELHTYLAEAITRLSPEHRLALVLRDVDGYSYAEIAHILRVPLGTVKSRISRARSQLRTQLLAQSPTSTPAPYFAWAAA